ncbi:unnamed protein product [Rotaria sp. Silwood1]|nr:unnamed protein product [Rotaria sp. Silwood1]
MENSIQWHIPTENVNNSVASPILRAEVNINDDDLSQEAKAQFGYHTEILHAFRLNARNVLANDGLSPIGRHLFCINLEKDYMNCKRVLNYVAKNMQLKRTAGLLPPTFFICGLPRTGSTLLFNLLACDPLCRAPLATDLFYPVPPLARSDTTGQAQRIIEHYQEITNDLTTPISAKSSQVWQYAIRCQNSNFSISCLCPNDNKISINNGWTSTLRRHLITKYQLHELTLLSNERKRISSSFSSNKRQKFI